MDLILYLLIEIITILAFYPVWKSWKEKNTPQKITDILVCLLNMLCSWLIGSFLYAALLKPNYFFAFCLGAWILGFCFCLWFTGRIGTPVFLSGIYWLLSFVLVWFHVLDQLGTGFLSYPHYIQELLLGLDHLKDLI